MKKVSLLALPVLVATALLFGSVHAPRQRP